MHWIIKDIAHVLMLSDAQWCSVMLSHALSCSVILSHPQSSSVMLSHTQSCSEWLQYDSRMTPGWLSMTLGWLQDDSVWLSMTSGWLSITPGWLSMTPGWLSMTPGWLRMTQDDSGWLQPVFLWMMLNHYCWLSRSLMTGRSCFSLMLYYFIFHINLKSLVLYSPPDHNQVLRNMWNIFQYKMIIAILWRRNEIEVQ